MKNLPKICTRCILPETFPGISFDENGVCNHCQKYRGQTADAALKAKYEQKFLDLLKSNRRSDTYDVLMAYSGGKDSTYTLDLFVNRYNLRVLALTFDNTFISEKAFTNMQVVCSALGVDHLVIRPDSTKLRSIFRIAAQEELYSAKTLERASTICTSCIGLVKAITLRTAIEKAIPFVGFGWSPGQAPIQSSVMKANAPLMKTAQKAILEPLRRIAGSWVDPFFVTEEQFTAPEKFPWNVHPLAFLDYDEKVIIARNNEIGWEKPVDTDPNSTNCRLNGFANQVHLDKYRFHPYVWEIANMVRNGALEKEKGIEKIYYDENLTILRHAKEELLGVPEKHKTALTTE